MAPDPPPRLGVLFVCHANVCRSPLAEGIFRHKVAAAGLGDALFADSAGTYALDGSPPHPHSVEVARRHGIRLDGRARALEPEDLYRFAEILVMDRRNLADIERYRRLSAFGAVEGRPARIRLARSLVRSGPLAGRDVPDPVGAGPEAYEHVYRILDAACDVLLAECRRRLARPGEPGEPGGGSCPRA